MALVTFMLVVTACTGSTDSPPTARAEIDAELEAAIDRQLGLEGIYDDVRAILVIAQGRTAYEKYFQTSPEGYRDVESVTNSVLPTLVGIAVDEGKIHSIDQTLAELLPSYTDVMRPFVARTTLRQVLTMTAGFQGDFNDPALEFMDSKDAVRTILDTAATTAEATFAYSNGGAHLVSAILAEATGMSVLDYARSRLFDPLDIVTDPAAEPLAVDSNRNAYDQASFAWPVDRQGLHLGWGLLKLRPQDMAKLGTLFLDQGQWEGHQLVPAAWTRDATTAQVTAEGATDGYGYMWWVGTSDGDPAYLAWGYGCQLIEVIPSRRLVVVISTALDLDDPNSRGVSTSVCLNMVDSVIAPVFRP